MHARGVYVIKRQYRSPSHLSQDQRSREKFLPEAVRGRKARFLHEKPLVADRETHMDSEVPEMDHSRPFYYQVLEGKSFVFTNVDNWIRIQLHLLTTFLRGGGQLWVLEDFWMQVEISTCISAATCDFNRSQEHISVSSLSFCCFVP